MEGWTVRNESGAEGYRFKPCQERQSASNLAALRLEDSASLGLDEKQQTPGQPPEEHDLLLMTTLRRSRR